MTCSHEACDCEIPANRGQEAFCGSHCEMAVARDVDELVCRCGHAECGEAAERPAQPLPHATP